MFMGLTLIMKAECIQPDSVKNENKFVVSNSLGVGGIYILQHVYTAVSAVYCRYI